MRTLRSLVSSVALIAAATPSSSADLVLVQRPADHDADAGSDFRRCVPGGRIVRVGADGQARVLTEGFSGACDPAVSFDGRTILFSGQKDVDASWQIWRMTSDGEDAVQLTTHDGDATAPIFVGAIFHLDDEQPTRRIAYLAKVHDSNEAPALHTAELDGGEPIRISYSPGSDLAPDVLANGRLVYPFRPPPAGAQKQPTLSVMGLNIDGTDLMAFIDPHDLPAFTHAVRVSGDDRLYFINSISADLGGGDLGFVSLRRPLGSREVLARATDGVFLDPVPLADGGLLASHRNPRTGLFEIASIDPGDGALGETVFQADGYDCLDAQELAVRPVVPGRSTVVDLERETGVFFCISTHITDRPSLAHLRSGGASRVRVVEYFFEQDSQGMGRTLGEAPVETDGSFHIEVPARTPLRFQLLDDTGATVGEQRSWTWVMPREWRGCIGCHEDREMVAPNVLADAVVKPAVRLVGPEISAGGGE